MCVSAAFAYEQAEITEPQAKSCRLFRLLCAFFRSFALFRNIRIYRNRVYIVYNPKRNLFEIPVNTSILLHHRR